MNWLNVVLGFVIMIGVLIAWFRWMSRMRGDSGSTLSKLDVGRRGRKATAGSINELEQIIAAHRSGSAPAPAMTEATGAPAPSRGEPAPAPPAGTAPPASEGGADTEFLRGPGKLAYLLLRTALPELLVFASVPASRLQASPPPVAGQDHVFDLVLCRQDFTIVAAIDLRPSDVTGPSPGAWALTRRIEYLALDPARLPRREQLRSLMRADG